MIFSRVVFPNQLIHSLQEGTCVIFAGAGVSVYPPALLPTFRQLAKTLTGLEPTEPLDRFLGQHPHANTFKKKTQEIIESKNTHNPIHEHLAAIFTSTDSVRIVTTNYDKLFELACEKVFGCRPIVYHSPALPLGSNFTGIVHVHGSFEDERGIVLTDEDFGAAYLVEGWARRFLLGLFQKWDILFVGYTHNDVVMNYLARALPPSATRNRYALDFSPSPERLLGWAHLDITPISYGDIATPNDHQQQVDAVAGLCEFLRRSALEWARLLAKAVSDGPPMDKAFASQLTHALRNELQCSSFLDHHPGIEWVEWLSDQGFFKSIFGTSPIDSATSAIAHWLSHDILASHPHVVMNLLCRNPECQQEVWHKMTHGLLQLPATTERSVATKLIGILLHRMPDRVDQLNLQWLADAAAIHENVEVLIDLLKYAIGSTPEFKESRSGGQELRQESAFRINNHHTDHIIKRLNPYLDSCLYRLFAIACEGIEARRSIVTSWGVEQDAYDADSYGRSAIESHPQDQHLDDIDPLLNLIQEIVHRLGESDPAFVKAWISIGLQSSSVLLRRMAIHASAIDGLLDQEVVIDILKNGPIDDIHCHHEVFVATKNIFIRSTKLQQVHILQVFAQAYGYTDDTADDHVAYRYFTIIHYLVLSQPDNDWLKEILTSINAKFPEFQPREHPDFTHYWTTRWGGDPSPLSDDQIRQLSPDELIVDVVQRWAQDGVTRDSSAYYEAITRIATKETDWRDSLYQHMLGLSDCPPRLFTAIIKSYCQHLSDPTHGVQALAVISDQRVLEAEYELLASAIWNLIDKDPPDHVLVKLPELDILAERIWVKSKTTTRSIPEDWLGAAINAPSGIIAEYITGAISARCRQAAEGVKPPIPPILRSMVGQMISDSSVHGGMCRSVLCSQLGLFAWLDSAMAQELLPLFTSSDPMVKAQAWQGFLTWGRMTPELAALLKPTFDYTLAGNLKFFGESKRRFAMHLLAAGAMLSDVDSLAWATNPQLHADSEFGKAISSHSLTYIQDAPEEIMRKHWEGWIAPYWRQRVLNNPVTLLESEVVSYLDALDHLEPVLESAVDILESMPDIALHSHNYVFLSLHDSGIDQRRPLLAARICRYALRNIATVGGFHQADTVLRVIVPQMPNLTACQSLVELAMQRRAITSTVGLSILAADGGQRV
jgi:SIR2-like domain/Domain of unknown function (DUF4020)